MSQVFVYFSIASLGQKLDCSKLTAITTTNNNYYHHYYQSNTS